MQTAVLLVRCLQTLGWFEGQTCSSSEDGADKRVSAGGEQGDKTDLLMYTASLLLHHICQLICNGHAVTSLTGDSGDCGVQSVTQTRIATAIYPTVSLMNHSCEPSIISRLCTALSLSLTSYDSLITNFHYRSVSKML